MPSLTHDDIKAATDAIMQANALLKFGAFVAKRIVSLPADDQERASLTWEFEGVFRAIRDQLDRPMEVLMDLEDGRTVSGPKPS